MEIVKKNILSIICGVIALAALIALAWPLNGMYAEAQALLMTRVKANDELTHLHNARRSWPEIPDVESGAQTKLTLFPNDLRISKGDEIKDQVHTQALEMQKITADNNQHEPLLPNIFPSPGDRRFAFQAAYQEEVQKNLPALLKSTRPPTDSEIKLVADHDWKTQYEPKIITIAGKAVNLDQTIKDWQDAAAKLPARLRSERAQKYKVYLDESAIAINHSILNSPQGPREEEIWFAQSMLWVEQDLIAAINRINQSAANITESPVKQVTRIGIAEDQNQYIAAAGAAGAVTQGPQQGPSGPDYARSPTGRLSNSLYDVVQFDLVLNVDARKIPSIIAELQRDKLITIHWFNVVSINGLAAAEDGYIYGDVPVATLTMRGEELFLRNWTTKLMPDSIKAKLGVVVTPIPPR